MIRVVVSIIIIVVVLLFLAPPLGYAFVIVAPSATTLVSFYCTTTSTTTSCSYTSLSMAVNKDVDNQNEPSLRRRTLLLGQACMVTSGVLTTTKALPSLTTSTTAVANALVYVDPNRYGDKELQVGTIVKLRQCIRNVLCSSNNNNNGNNNIALAPAFVHLAIQDALSYNYQTQTGGPDGHIVPYVLQRKPTDDDPALLLYEAALELQGIHSQLQQSTAVTMADVVTFAGAEAIELLGGPRIVLPLGKLDATTVSNNNGNQKSMTEIYNLDNGPETIRAFANAGLTERDVTLLMGALTSMRQVIEDDSLFSNTTNKKKQKSKNIYDDNLDDDDENEMNDASDEDDIIPMSFGSSSSSSSSSTSLYTGGRRRMDDSIFRYEATLQKNNQATGVWANDVVAEWTMRYASSKGGLVKDLPEAYRRLVQVGSVGRWET